MGEMDLASCYDGMCGMANRDLSGFDVVGALMVPVLGLALMVLFGV